MRGLGGLARDTERSFGSIAGLAGSRLGIPGGYDDGEYRMTRSSNRLRREQMRGERYENSYGGGYGMRSRSRSGRGGGFSDEDLVMLEQLRQDPEVQEELAKHGLSVEDTMWDGLDTANPYQIAAAARTVERRHRTQQGAGSSPTAPSSAPGAPAGYVDRDQYMQALQIAQNLGSEFITGSTPQEMERSWEQALANDPTNKAQNGGRWPSDKAAYAVLLGHINELSARGASVAPPATATPASPAITRHELPPPDASAPASYSPTPTSPTITRHELSPPGASAPAPYSPAPTSSYSGLDAEGSMHFDTYGGLYRGMENDPQVERMQRYIGIVGGGNLNPDGNYGPKTHAAVNNLRQRWGMGEGRADSDFLNRLSHEYNQITGLIIPSSQPVQDVTLSTSITGGEQVVSAAPPAPTPSSYAGGAWDVHRG